MNVVNFLQAIGHSDRVYIRCLPPKNSPLLEIETRGMTYTNKEGEIKISVVRGYINLENGEFSQQRRDRDVVIPDGWGYLKSLNQQGYGIYFATHHGGGRNDQITHGSALFHESDRASFEDQQREIDRITAEFGKPTAVVKTRKSLHAYWASEIIRIDRLPTYQRRWIQYSNCDDDSLADPAQLMRLPYFDHLSWNTETQDFDRVPCELLQLNDVRYSLAEFDRQKRQKQEDLGDKPNSPACREFYVDDYTYESLAYISQFQKSHCLLIKIDELKGFTDFEKYGTANNRSRMLSLYDGHELKVTRKGSPRIHIEKTGISLVGTTQYTTLSKIFEQDDNKEDGLWARLVFFNLPTTATYSHDPHPDGLLYTALAKIYATIDGFSSQTFTATSAAQKLWAEWYNDMVDLTIEQSGTFLESIYGKAKDRVARLALALHLLLAAADNKQPDREVSASTMYHAIELGKYLLLETETVLALTGSNPTTDPTDARILKFINRFAGKGWVTARMVTHWWSGKTKPSVKDIRAFMLKVVELGYARENDESKRKSSDYQIKILENHSNSSNKNPQSDVQQQKMLLLKHENSSNSLVTTAPANIPESPQDNGLVFVTNSCDNPQSSHGKGCSHHHASIVTNQLLEEEFSSNSLKPLPHNNLSNSVTKVTGNSRSSQSQPGNLPDVDIDSIPLATEDDF